MVNIVILLTNSDIRDSDIPIKSSNLFKEIEKLITNRNIKDIIEKGGTGKINIIGEWEIDKDSILLAFGYINGKKSDENQHELPPNNKLKNNTYYGDIILTKINSKRHIKTFNCEEYEKLYQEYFGNMSDNELESDVGEEDEDEDEDEDEADFDDINKEIDEIIEEDISELQEEEDEEDEDEEDGEVADAETENDDIIEDDYNENFEELGQVIKQKKKKNKKNNNDDWSEWEVSKEEADSEFEFCENDNSGEETLDLSEYNETRTEFIKLLSGIVDEEVSTKIEESILKSVISSCESRKIVTKWNNTHFNKMYLNKARSIYTNIDKHSYIKNNYLADNLSNLNLETIGFMSYQELNPQHWKRLLDKKYKKQEELYETKQEAMTDEFKCKRCKSRKTSYYEMQTRSADEPMTIFITCLNCGNRWKN
jgi:transcription elongation factor S-II